METKNLTPIISEEKKALRAVDYHEHAKNLRLALRAVEHHMDAEGLRLGLRAVEHHMRKLNEAMIQYWEHQQYSLEDEITYR